MKVAAAHILLLATLFIIVMKGCNGKQEQIIDRWPSGKPKVVKNFYHADTLRYQLISYYDNGNISEVKHLDGQDINGWNVHYYPNGIVKDSIFLELGLPVAKSMHFHINGVLESSGSYQDGKVNGPWNYYDSIGNLIETTVFGAYETPQKSSFFNPAGWLIKEVDRYLNGETKEIINYKDSLKHGTYQAFDPSGLLKREGQYDKGMLFGTNWTIYYSSGQKFKEIKYITESEEESLFINLWNPDGHQTIKGGNGYYRYEQRSPCNGDLVVTDKITLFYTEGKQVDKRLVVINDCK